MNIDISHIDHLVLTVKDIETTCQFYQSVLDIEIIHFDGNRKALKFGSQKFNLHELNNPIEPNAKNATPGTTGIYLICNTPLKVVLNRLQELDIPIIEGPILKTGETFALNSIYIYDPDKNLIEISNIICP